MPSQLYANDKISFLCAKNFTYRAKPYQIGDDFPQEEAHNIETMVRARFVIPVVEEHTEKPRHWHRHVRTKDEAIEFLLRERVQLRMPHETDSDQVVDITQLTHPQMTEEELEQERQSHQPGATGESTDRTDTTENHAPAEVAAEQAGEATHSGQYDPTYHTVREVNEHLAQEHDPEERERILGVEEANRGRKGILEA